MSKQSVNESMFDGTGKPGSVENMLTVVNHIKSTGQRVVAGIDEAGRGPVIGPMVYAICVLPLNAVTQYKDSKVLTPSQREQLFQGIKSYAYVAISPEYISSHMLVESLNVIARRAVCELLAALRERCSNVATVYVDALGDNNSYRTFLSDNFPFYQFVVECKADSKYQVVSGASIVAKVTRDEAVAPLNCGSGYPSDPVTIAWLRKHMNPVYGFPKEVRHSWSTVKKMLPTKKSREFRGKYKGNYQGPG
ncbi:ribonuclease H2 subunit A [Pancytospora epiphaga]|nr:ribonuclease H2 subunit A [Pancytospora epiphaga]